IDSRATSRAPRLPWTAGSRFITGSRRGADRGVAQTRHVAAAPPSTGASRVRAAGIRIKQLLAVDLVAGNDLLALRRDQPIDELLPQLFLHGRVLLRIDQHD